MASLIKQYRKYYLQFFDSDRNPNRKKVPLGVSAKSEAKKIERRLTAAYHAGEYDPWYDDPKTFRVKRREEFTMATAVPRFLQDKAREGRAERTLENYRGFIRRLIDTIGDHALDALTPTLLNEWIRDPEVTDTTRHSRYRYVHAFLNHCVRQGWMDQNPLQGTRAPTRQEKLPKTMYKKDLRKITEAVRRDYENKRQRGLCDPNEVIWRSWAFRFAFYTGLRGGELARLQFQHIDRERSLIYVLKQKNNKEQTIPLVAKAEEVLNDVPTGTPTTHVFGGPATRNGSRNFTAWRNNLSRAFRRYRKAAGIDRPISLHSLRHGFCTALAEAGKSAVVIKEAARHADISTSMRYVHMANETLKAEIGDVFN
jgi:integrase